MWIQWRHVTGRAYIAATMDVAFVVQNRQVLDSLRALVTSRTLNDVLRCRPMKNVVVTSATLVFCSSNGSVNFQTAAHVAGHMYVHVGWHFGRNSDVLWKYIWATIEMNNIYLFGQLHLLYVWWLSVEIKNHVFLLLMGFRNSLLVKLGIDVIRRPCILKHSV